jgi:phosphomannomutase
VDEKGEVVPMDYIIALLGKEMLKKHPGGLILMDLRSSNAVKESVEKAGGKVHHCRVGHSLIKRQMRQEGAIFAGELSGHYFFEENSKAEMATLAAMTILNQLNATGKKMSELTADLKIYFHSGEINSDVEDKRGMMDKLKEIYQEGKLDELDGIRIDFPEWWFNVRPSNTEPVLRLNLEAKTKKLMEQKRDELLALIGN